MRPWATRKRSSLTTKTTMCSVMETVIIKWVPGHTQGHQMLYLKPARTGGVLLSGDLYHYPEERTLNRVPTFDCSDSTSHPAGRRLTCPAVVASKNIQRFVEIDFGGITNAAVAFYCLHRCTLGRLPLSWSPSSLVRRARFSSFNRRYSNARPATKSNCSRHSGHNFSNGLFIVLQENAGGL